jgi:hypothetical protein
MLLPGVDRLLALTDQKQIHRISLLSSLHIHHSRLEESEHKKNPKIEILKF